jgi:hypothetical protein
MAVNADISLVLTQFYGVCYRDFGEWMESLRK